MGSHHAAGSHFAVNCKFPFSFKSETPCLNRIKMYITQQQIVTPPLCSFVMLIIALLTLYYSVFPYYIVNSPDCEIMCRKYFHVKNRKMRDNVHVFDIKIQG